jgi:hypothetical protein
MSGDVRGCPGMSGAASRVVASFSAASRVVASFSAASRPRTSPDTFVNEHIFHPSIRIDTPCPYAVHIEPFYKKSINM